MKTNTAKNTTTPSAKILSLLLTAQQSGKVCAVLDMGRTFDLNDAAQLGVNTAQLLVSQPENEQQATEITETLAASGSVGLVVCCQFTAASATLATAQKTGTLVVHDNDIFVRDVDDMLGLVSDVMETGRSEAAVIRESKVRTNRMAAAHDKGFTACEVCGRAVKGDGVIVRDEDGKHIGTVGPSCAVKMRSVLAQAATR